MGSIATKEETDQLSRQLESDEGARLKYLYTADLLGILTTQEEFHEPVIDPLEVAVTDNLPAIDGWAYAIAIHPQDRTAAIGGVHGQIRRMEILSSAEK